MQHVIPECYKEPNVIREKSWRLRCSTVSLMTSSPSSSLSLPLSVPGMFLLVSFFCCLTVILISSITAIYPLHWIMACDWLCVGVVGESLLFCVREELLCFNCSIKWTGSEGTTGAGCRFRISYRKFVIDLAKYLDSFRVREAYRKCVSGKMKRNNVPKIRSIAGACLRLRRRN